MIGTRLKEIRKTLKLSQPVFSKALEISEKTLWDYENNKTPIKSNVVEKLVKNHNVNAEFLFSGEGQMFKREIETPFNSAEDAFEKLFGISDKEEIELLSKLFEPDNKDLLKTFGEAIDGNPEAINSLLTLAKTLKAVHKR